MKSYRITMARETDSRWALRLNGRMIGRVTRRRNEFRGAGVPRYEYRAEVCDRARWSEVVWATSLDGLRAKVRRILAGQTAVAIR